MTSFTPTEVAAFVAESRAAQGLPARVEDEATARRVAAVMVAAPATDGHREAA